MTPTQLLHLPNNHSLRTTSDSTHQVALTTYPSEAPFISDPDPSRPIHSQGLLLLWTPSHNDCPPRHPSVTLLASDSIHLQMGLQAHLHPAFWGLQPSNDGVHYRNVTISNHRAAAQPAPTWPLAGPAPQGFRESRDHEGANWLRTSLAGCLLFQMFICF